MKIFLNFSKRHSATFLLVALSLFIALYISADTITDAFESYTNGTINGQGGWLSLGSAGSGCAVYDHAVVDNTYGYASFGAKSLRMSNAVTSGCFGDQTFSKSLTNDAGESMSSDAATGGLSGGTRQSYFEAEWDFASTVPGAEQPGLSVVASPDRGDGARMSWIQMTDTPSGLEVNFYDYQISALPPTGDFVFTNVISGLDRSIPHHIKITMAFVDGPQNDIVKVYVDGTLLHTGTSWEDYFRQNELPAGTRTVDCMLFRTGGTAASATAGKGFLIDNLRAFSGALPKGFVFLAAKDVTIDRLGNSEGNIHANNDIVFKKGSSTTYKGDLTAVDDISIGSKNKITGNLTAGDDIDVASGATVSGTQTEHTAVATQSLPNPAFSAGGSSVSVPASGTRTLAPGSYKVVTVNKKSTLKLSSGDYFVEKLEFKESAKLIIDVGAGPVKINVVNKLSFDAKVVVSITPAGEAGSNQVTFTQLDDDAVIIGQSAKVLGTIIAVEAEVRLSKSSRFKGAVYAEDIVVEQGVVFLPHGASTSLPKTSEFEAPDFTAANVITDYVLEQNYPNPFNPTTQISYSVPSTAQVSLKIFNLAGQEVATLVNEQRGAGRYTVTFDASRLTNGVYFSVLQAGDVRLVRRLLLLK